MLHYYHICSDFMMHFIMFESSALAVDAELFEECNPTKKVEFLVVLTDG